MCCVVWCVVHSEQYDRIREIIRGRLLEEQRIQQQQQGGGPVTRWRLSDLIHLGEQSSIIIPRYHAQTYASCTFEATEKVATHTHSSCRCRSPVQQTQMISFPFHILVHIHVSFSHSTTFSFIHVHFLVCYVFYRKYDCSYCSETFTDQKEHLLHTAQHKEKVAPMHGSPCFTPNTCTCIFISCYSLFSSS